MKKHTHIVISAIVCATALPCLASAEPYEAQLSDSQVLLTDASLSKARLAECQPMKGERVSVLETKLNLEGMTGVNAARVVILEGACKGTQGWVGTARLEKVPSKN